MFISGQNDVLSLDVEQEYDVSRVSMGELYPVLSVQGAKDSNLYYVYFFWKNCGY